MKNKIKTLLIVTLVLLFSCENKNETTALKQIANLPKDLKEISGIAFYNNLIYTLEDSGNPNNIVVIDTLGNTKKTISVTNIENIDWEDLTFDNKGNLYIGDFGNNDNVRKDLAIHKINQTELQNDEVETAYKITFDYPEQKEFPPKKKELLFDVEGFFEYHNHFYLFTKNRSKGFDGTSYIYKIPNKAGHHHAQLIKTITTCSDYHNCAITSATISPDGSKFGLLSHSKIWLFENYTNDDITTGKMTELDLKHYSQKEAICFKNNNDLFLADEKVKKTGGNLFQVNLQSLKSYFKDNYQMEQVHGRPNHPQTQGKIERYHRTMKNVVKLDNYFAPEELEAALEKFVYRYNNERYHESLNNLTPADVYFGRCELILKEREKLKKIAIINRRNEYQKSKLTTNQKKKNLSLNY